MRFGGPVVPLVSMRTATPGRTEPPGGPEAPPAPGSTASGTPRSVAPAVVARRAGRHEVGQVGRIAGEQRQVEGGDVVAGALAAAPGVDRHDAPPGPQHAEQQPDRGRPVAQEDAHLGAGPIDQGGDLPDGVGEGAPAAPRPGELDGVGRRVEGEDVGDPGGEPGGGRRAHRSLGSVRAGGFSATSAMPIGLPSRV